jgi:hypothetical protein
MSQREYARFLEAHGLRVLEFESALWVEKRKFFFENIPPHQKLHLEAHAQRWLFRKGAAAIRYTCQELDGRPSFEYVCSEKNFSLESLAPDARRRVRRGMESCEIRPIDCSFLARYGCPINRDTLARQGRSGVVWMTDEGRWRKYMLACATIPTVQIFGAFVKERFIGFSIAVKVDDYCYLHHTQAYSEDLKLSPINILTYYVTKRMLDQPDIRHVSQGLEPFLLLPAVERFKLAMGFRKRALRRNVVVNPIARPMFSTPSIWFARKTLGVIRPGLVEDLSTFTKALEIQ